MDNFDEILAIAKAMVENCRVLFRENNRLEKELAMSSLIISQQEKLMETYKGHIGALEKLLATVSPETDREMEKEND